MAITTLSSLASGRLPQPEHVQKVSASREAAGVLHSTFYEAGSPAAAAAPTPGINGAALTTYAGQIPFDNPASGNTYLDSMRVNSSLVGPWLLCDRLWHNSGITATTTTEQAITSPTWPARDMNGATDGVGVMVGVEVSAATTNAAAITNMTLNYTNSAGDGTKTGTILSFPATAAAGTFVPFLLAAGDVGIRSVQGLTLGTSLVTGTVHLVAYRVIAMIGLSDINAARLSVDAIGCGFPRLYDNTVPFLVAWPSATAAPAFSFRPQYAQG